jgi:hypothetical protein
MKREVRSVPSKKTTKSNPQPSSIVNFDFQERTYQIDPQRHKVYRHFVEIETSRAFEIYSHWRANHLTV